jgi:signal transduction histidine kinase
MGFRFYCLWVGWTFASTQLSFAQLLPVDSLLIRAKNTTLADSVRIEAWEKIADYYATRNFEESYSAASEGASIAKRNKQFGQLANLTRLQGLASYFKQRFDSAAHYYYQALDLAQRHQKRHIEGEIFNNLGQLFRKTRDLERSLEHYDKAFAIFQDMGDDNGMATILNESGVVFEYQNKFDEAIRRYQKSMDTRVRMKDTVGMTYSLNFMGTAFTEAGKYPEAEKSLRACQRLREIIRDSFALALTHSDLGSLYLRWNKHQEARASFLISNRLAEAMRYPDLQMHNYQRMAELEEKTGNALAALQWLRQYNTIKDSAYNTDKMKQIESLEARYQNRAKTQALQLQAAEIRQKNITIFALATGASLVLALGYLLYKRRQAKLELQVQTTRLEERQRATQAILEAEEKERSRIAADLHDGVGQLMSAARLNLSGMHAQQFTDHRPPEVFEKALSLVDDSCREIRSISHQMMPQILQRKGLELALLEFTQKIRHPELNITLHVEGIDAPLPSLQAGVIYRMIQEGVNNVIKHAQAKNLDISVIQEKNELSITLEDNGIGFDPQVAAEGIGLQNLRSRVQFLEGEIDIHSAPGKGTLIAIHIPIPKNELP